MHSTGRGTTLPQTEAKQAPDTRANSVELAAVEHVTVPRPNIFPMPLAYRIGKRILDVAGAFCGLFFLAPLFLIAAILIFLDSPGPILHRRRVLARQKIGSKDTAEPQNLAQFDAFKFRTMRPDADTYLFQNPDLLLRYQENFKLDEDPRVTRIGRFLRKTSIDELPQLVNVLLGQMTLVGPRMITPPELSRYGDNADALLSVLPGLTGLWQVTGRSSVSYTERVRLDMLYIENRSFAFDLEILLRTVRSVLKAEGAS